MKSLLNRIFIGKFIMQFITEYLRYSCSKLFQKIDQHQHHYFNQFEQVEQVEEFKLRKLKSSENYTNY